jgi:two-component sensor histidine kinase
VPERLAKRLPPIVTEVAVGVAAALLALAIRKALSPFTGDEAPFAIIFSGVLLACLVGGWRSGLVALVAGQGLTWFYILPPVHSFGLNSHTAAALAVASASQLALVAMTGLYQREMRKDAEALQEQLRIREHLVAELNHRVKNTLAIVQSIGHQSLRRDAPLEEAAKAFEGRLMALASAHQILTKQNWQEVEIRDVIAQTLEPHGNVGDRFVLDGPAVRLTPKSSVTLAMTVHELATNALKYGALTSSSGSVAVHWSVDAERFRLQWREQGGPECSPPARKGFGTRMLERAFASDIGGKAKLTFAPEGLRYLVEAPARQPL